MPDPIRPLARLCAAALGAALASAPLFAAAPAAAQRYVPPPVVRPAPVVVRPAPPRWQPGNPYWWRGHPDFVGYVGVRRGYYFAPGYGYYPVGPAYYRRAWVVGTTLPVAMRRYYVVNPGYYGLAVAPAGHAWIYANGRVVLASRTTGVIIRTGPRIW
jgi:hypothetical protein